MKYRFITLIATVGVLFSIAVPASAVNLNNDTQLDDSQVEYYLVMEDQIKSLYQHKADYRIYTPAGLDITDEFLLNNQEAFESGNYNSIADTMSSERLTIAGAEEYCPYSISTEDGNASILGQTIGVTVKKRYTTYFDLGIKHFYATYDIYGSYKVNDSTFQIISITSGPTVSKNTVVASNVFNDADADFNFGNASLKREIRSDKKSVRFYGYFEIRAVSNNVIGLYQDTPVNFSFIGYGNGNVS